MAVGGVAVWCCRRRVNRLELAVGALQQAAVVRDKDDAALESVDRLDLVRVRIRVS